MGNLLDGASEVEIRDDRLVRIQELAYPESRWEWSHNRHPTVRFPSLCLLGKHPEPSRVLVKFKAKEHM